MKCVRAICICTEANKAGCIYNTEAAPVNNKTSGMENDTCEFCGLRWADWSPECKYRDVHSGSEEMLWMPPPKEPPLGNDMVVLPKHYAMFEIEPIHFIATNKFDFLAGNIIKYTARAEHKHAGKGKEDTLKVVRYAIMRGKKLQGDPDWWKPYKDEGLAAAIEKELSYGAH